MIVLEQEQIDDLARGLGQILTEFYGNPANEKEFQRWLEERKESTQLH